MSSSDTTTNAKVICAAAAVTALAWKAWSASTAKPAEPKKPVVKDKAPSKVKAPKFDLASALRREELTFGKL